MNIITKAFLIVTIIFSLPSFSIAQMFQIGAGSGLTQIVAPEIYTNFYSTEWNVGVIAKLGIPLLPITPRAFFLYHSLSGNGFINNGNEPPINSEVSLDISEVGVGIQYNFIPFPVGFDPYIALDIAYNSFSTLEGNDNPVPNTDDNRFGVGIGLGTEITIIPIIDLDVYASYKMFNLVGKEDGEDNITAFTLDAFILLSFL